MPTDEVCPRCGATFTCSADAPGCGCGQVELTDVQRKRLAERYTGCLCGACLREVAREVEEAT